ncbi:hypothetical protein N7495_003145 [Penicillium taxi]|uniref:uncharacterized protein n=1 Tax=Penicillium taxi TaxID=168475 RepID=UPI0025457BF1|nr:uncharacterized protein N7495_003145 [Penicillium taxi]KAJ5902617.1 hypothetical protein N7495_003145 [Penicillium taxi]
MAVLLKNVAIVGASGTIGRIVLEALLGSSKFNVTVISREESEAVFPRGVKVLKIKFSGSSLETAFQGQDVVISTVGAAAFHEQKDFVDAAIRAGVQRFIPSEFSSNSQNDAVLQLLPLFGAKKELIEYLKSKESYGLTWTAVATSGLFDWGIRSGFLGFDIENLTATIWDGGDKNFTLTNEKQLGQSVISVLEHPQGTSNQYLYVASVETNQKEIVTALEKATGARWTLKDSTTEEQVKDGFAKLSAGDFSGALTLVRVTCFGNTPGLHANYCKEEKLANSLLGLTMESVTSTIKSIIG